MQTETVENLAIEMPSTSKVYASAKDKEEVFVFDGRYPCENLNDDELMQIQVGLYGCSIRQSFVWLLKFVFKIAVF
jgi:hypothetical protein